MVPKLRIFGVVLRTASGSVWHRVAGEQRPVVTHCFVDVSLIQLFRRQRLPVFSSVSHLSLPASPAHWAINTRAPHPSLGRKSSPVEPIRRLRVIDTLRGEASVRCLRFEV